MNLIRRIRDGLGGTATLTPAAQFALPRNSPIEAPGLPCYCPDCGSGNASETTERDRRSTRLTCPDCGLNRRTELLRWG